jgi:DNA ligase (NAD+)
MTKKTRELWLGILKKWDNAYYNLGKPLVTDMEYDILRSEFKKNFPDDPYFKEVGAPLSVKYEEIKIPFVMGGLDKVDSETVEAWIKKGNGDDIHISEKLDGNSIGCIWENGILVSAFSRGDGEVGQNLLNKAKYFIPNIPCMGRAVLRGEVILRGDTYKELGFKNRRNGVTGLLRRDEIIPEDLNKLSVMFYEIVEAPDDIKWPTQLKIFNFIQDKLNLEIPFHILMPEDIDASFLEELLKERKEVSDYDIDGLVLSYNHSERENVKYSKSKVKFKVNEEAVRCQVIDVEWNVTRTGYVKPVIIIEPTEIMGATVSRVTGFNYNYILSHNIGVGAEIGVVRSGDVIPYITEIFKDAGLIDIPINCPCCGSKLIRTNKELICESNHCKEKSIYKIAHFFKEMGCDNITDRTIEMLGVNSIEEMYLLKVEDIAQKIEGFGQKKATIIIDEVKKTLITKPENLLAAFGVPSIGTTIAKKLCSRFKIPELFDIEQPDFFELGPITNVTLKDNLQQHKPLYNFLKSKGLQFIKESYNENTMKGIKFALTGAGKLKRKEYVTIIEAKGGSVSGASKDTNYLVCDDVSSGSDKIQKAQKFGTKIITYDELMKLLEK